jgi:glycerophosphoryl diester phosphodiesterase
MTAPQVIAHRGLAATHRENTIPAFRAALAVGVGGIELDVHATRDGALVVQHDPVLSSDVARHAGRQIAELTLLEVRSGVHGEALPLLSEVIEEVSGRCTLYVELKAKHIESEVARMVARHASWCAVHSFDHRMVARLRALAPDVPRGVLMSSYLLDPVAPIADHAARDLWQQWELIDEDLVVAAHARGARVIAWTVNDPVSARQLAVWGVDGLCTDRADEFVHLARELQT